MQYVIVRAEKAGCFAGYLESHSPSGESVTLVKTRRLWYWEGAASLSQLAVGGTSKPDSCKFPAPVNRCKIFGILEILETTDLAREVIEAVPVWEA